MVSWFTSDMFVFSLLILLALVAVESESFLLFFSKRISTSSASSASSARTTTSIYDGNNVENDQKIFYGGLNHCGILVKDTNVAKDFFMTIFGFADETHLRPTTLPYPGAFLKCGVHQIHLMELPNPDSASTRPDYVGRDKHIALSINNIDIIKDRLEAINMPYKLSSSGRRALFCRDLDSNGFEFVEDTSLQ